MTYQEIKERLTQCEVKLTELHSAQETVKSSKNYNVAVQKLTVLKESLEKRLSEAEKTAFVNGQATEYTDEKELQKLKDNQDVKSIKTASGKKIKEQQGVTFSVEETSAIAKKTGKAVAMGLKALGDEVAHMKAKKIEENSFEIYVEYKNGADDQFSFYISDDTLHLVDFSFDKELVDVGVKPSGEAIVNVDVLSNELQKHWKSMKEGMSDQEFADAQENDRLNKHPEKDTILKIKALLAKEKQNQLKEAPKGMFYIEVSIRDARKALAIIDDQPALKTAVQIDDSNRYYLTDEELAYDLMMDFNAHDVEVIDNNIELDEAKEGEEMDEALNPEVSNAVNRFIKAMAKRYEYSEQDAVYAIMAALKQREFNGVSEAPEGGINQGGDLDIGHQDDEPDMLMKDIYDIATYAAKLHKMLKKYNDFDGEVDFPQWWQKKIILARDYISAAQHYLEAEEKQPALDQLALEGKEGDAHSSDEKKKTVKEDWGGSDQAAMNQSMHKDLGEPTEFPGLSKLLDAAEDAVDFYWDDWEEYRTDREGLVMNAARSYARKMFPEFMAMAAKMVEPADESVQEGFGKTKKAYDLVVDKMKELAKVYKSGDTSVIAQLKDLTTKKKELEKMLEKQAGGIGAGQELDPNASETKINEEKATCCGKCGRVHVKGTKCKTPYLKGKDHCRYN